MEELRFAIRCHGSSKKPRLHRRCSQCAIHHPALPAGGTLSTASGPEFNAGSAVANAVGADSSSPNGLLRLQSTSAGSLQPPSLDDVTHRRRVGTPRDQHDVTSDGYCATANNRYPAYGDVSQTSDQRYDVMNDYYRDINNERIRNYVVDTSYNNSGKL